jgi:hypothetical protein
MSRKIFLDAYYNNFNGFLGELSRVFPDDPDIPVYKTSLVLLQKTNPMLLVVEVIRGVEPYEKMIEERNADFFLKHDFAENIAQDGTLEPIIQKIKALWQTLSVNNQKCIWDYITLLVGLAKRCQAAA